LESLWPELFNEQDIKTPTEILEIQAKFLPKLTKDMVYAEIVQPNEVHSAFINYDFLFRLNLKGKFLENYRFTVLTFAHNISFYPVKIQLDKDISVECGMTENRFDLKNEYEFISFLKDVFNSQKMRIVITAIMKLSNLPNF